MLYFVEAWNCKDSWKELPQADRQQYMGQVGQHIGGLLERGIGLLTWSENNATESHVAGYDYFAVWTAPNQELADEFTALIEGAGWYQYFDQVNLLGAEDSHTNIIGKMIAT